MISPIREEYAGVQFRSTLEAEWARHLDHCGVRWQYEPEGLTLSTGERYRPDFWLPELECWLEVKGPRVPRVEKAYQLGADGETVLIGYPSECGRVNYGWADRPGLWTSEFQARWLDAIGWPLADRWYGR